MQIMDGNKIKDEILNEIKYKVNTLDKKPSLTVIQVGNNESSNIYINQKRKMCEYVGFNFDHIKLDINISELELISLINKLNNNENISSILLQLPLPSHLNENNILNHINHFKDVDGLTDINAGMLMHDKDSLFPCTPFGIILLLNRYNIDIESKNIVIVGRSNLVGKPLTNLLINKGATVTNCNSKTLNLKSITKKADILISATGKKDLIKADMIKNHSVIIDVGIIRDKDGKIYGDVDYNEVKNIASFITPVPGGVGPMTIASLSINILKSFEKKEY